MPTFPMPFMPKEYHGQLSLMALMVYAGDPKEGEKVMAPFRALAKSWADMLKPMRYKDIFMAEEGDGGFHPTAVSHTMHIDTLDQTTATDIIAWLKKINAPLKAFQFRVLGGAMARVPQDATAYAHRNQAMMVNIAAFYETENDKPTRQKWVDDFARAIHQTDSAGYVGFFGPNEQDRLLDAYPAATLRRLAEVKKTYDPENLFKRNFNIVPSKS
jgi:hypothetical protein